MGGSSQKTNSTQQNLFPQWTQDAQQDTYQTGTGMLENFLRNPTSAVAGMNPDQLKAFDLARASAQNAFAGGQSFAPGQPNLTAATGTAAHVGGNAIRQGMNPYLEQVGDVTINRMRENYLDNDAQISAKYAAGNAFGGSGEALARGAAARGFNQDVAQTIAQLQSQGYDKATALAMANAQNDQQMRLANMSAENQMRGTAADYGLKAAQVNDLFRNSQMTREMANIAQLLGIGNQQQQFGQSVVDVPWTALQRLMGLTPQQTNSMQIGQSKTNSTASPMSMITSGISALTGLKGLFGGK